MENSKQKHRKPIFDNKHTHVTQPSDKLYQTSPAFNRNSSQNHSHPQSQVSYQSHIIYGSKPQQAQPPQEMIRSSSLPRTNHPINVRLSSPPPNIITHPIYRPSTPSVRITHPTSDVYRHPSPPKIYSRPVSQQPVLSRTVSPSFFHENQNKQTSIIRRSEVKPTLVAVQRVMRQVGQNQEERSTTILKPNLKSSCIREPKQLRVYQSINRKLEDDQKIYKLAQMNDLLAQSYDNLYDQLHNLQSDVSEKDVVAQNLFLKKSCLEIESIFNFQTQKTLTKLSKIHRQRRDKEIQKNQENKTVTQLTMKYAKVR